MKLLQILNELRGISFDARVWTPIILNAIIKTSKQSTDSVISGTDYPEQYQQFPIDFIHFTILKEYDNGAGYNEQKSGYEKDGKYHVYFMFGPKAGESSINHELRHAFEDFKRISKGYNPIKTTKESINLFGSGFEEIMKSRDIISKYMPFSMLIVGLYYTSRIERSAFSDTIYDNEYGFVADHVISSISNTIRFAQSQDIFKTYKPNELEQKWIDFNKKYPIKITTKFKNYQDFINWACNEINYKGTQTLKKLQKVKYFSSQQTN